MTIRRWEELTWPQAANHGSDTLAILAVAAIEQHGPHLPPGVDAMIGQHLLDQAPPGLNLLAPPIQQIGASDERLAFPGTLTLPPDLLIQLCTALGEGVIRAGVRRIVLPSSHGGNRPAMEIVAQALRVRGAMLAVSASWLGTPPGQFPAEEMDDGIHAGAIETSLMLRVRPDLVATSELADFPSTARRVAAENTLLTAHGPLAFACQAQDLHPSGACGDAPLASAEAGQEIARHQIGRFLRLLQEVARYLLDRLASTPGTPLYEADPCF